MPTTPTDLYAVFGFEPKFLEQVTRIEQNSGGVLPDEQWSDVQLLTSSTRGSRRFWIALTAGGRVGAFLIFREGRHVIEILNFAGNNPARKALWNYLHDEYLCGRKVLWGCVGGPSEDKA